MKICICDTSTLIKLRKGGVLHCLPALFDKVYIPDAVKNECRDPEVLTVLKTASFEIKTVKSILPIGLVIGEREAISLAVESRIK